MKFAAITLGVICWVPTLFVLYVVDVGHWFDGVQVLAAWAALLSVAIPAVSHFQRGGSLIPTYLVIATAPLLIVIGVIADILLVRQIFGNVQYDIFELAGAAISIVIFGCIGAILMVVSIHLTKTTSTATTRPSE